MEQEILKLYFEEKLKQNEIAKKLNISKDSIDIINELRNAYDIDNTEKRIKEIYLEIIYEYSICARLYVDSIIKGYSISNVDKHLNDFENEKDVKKMINSKDCFNKFITSYCKKNFSVLTDAINDIPSFFEKKKYTPEQIDYIEKNISLS